MKNNFIFNYKAVIRLLILSVFLLLNSNLFSQSRVAFKPRTSQKTPDKYKGVSTYNLQGDFNMIGNTNLTLSTYSVNSDNSNNQMIYADVDDDAYTFNSSSANFTHGLDASCTKIIYAGLYWTGRANDANQNTFNVTKDKVVPKVVPANTTQNVTNGNAIQYSTYSLDVLRINNSSTDRYPSYTFTGNGSTYVFEVTNSTTDRVRYNVNGGAWQNLASTYNSGVATLISPFTISDNSLTFTINSFTRNTANTGNSTSYTNTSNFASVRISGTGNELQSITKAFDKRKVKLKKEGGTYQDITAATTDIYYPSNTDDNMYSAYADVTDYVIAQGIGNYFVADIALTEGNGSSTGYYGGWGLVIIYENPSLKWRDITVFDGHGYIAGSIGAQELNVSGFQAVKNGPVNVKMGMMAGEGDRNIVGDYFNIRNAADNLWVGLNHSGNTAGNFFNSSIVTGGNARNPNLVNNTGLDVSMFDLANTNNTIIKNNQTSTRFQYGSTQDTYVIFNIVFAVDAYIPEVQVFNANESSVSNNGTVDPNQNIEFTSTIYNKGTEPINNGVVEIPLPHNVHYVSSNVTIGSGTSVVWSHPSGATDPNITPGGKLTWTVGNLIKPADPNTILAQLKYRIRITNDCTILTTGGACGLVINLDGTFKGTGTNSGIAINNGFVIGYNPDCGNTPIRDPFQMNIVPSQAFIDNCPVGVNNGTKQFKAFCSSPGNVIPRGNITSAYPMGSKFYSVSPAVAGYTSSLVSGDFPVTTNGNPTPYYAVLEGMAEGCFLKLETLVDKVTTQPTANNVKWCVGSPVVFNNQLSSYGAGNGYQLYYFNNANDTAPLTATPNPTAVGTYNYYVAEGLTKNGVTCFGTKVPFRVDIYPLPIISQDLIEDFFVCADAEKTITVQSNAATVVWEYFNTTTSTWANLTTSTFPNEVIPSGSEVKFSSPSIDRDQLKIRAKLSSLNSCTVYSKEVFIEVRLCNIITNPMLPAKIIKN